MSGASEYTSDIVTRKHNTNQLFSYTYMVGFQSNFFAFIMTGIKVLTALINSTNDEYISL